VTDSHPASHVAVAITLNAKASSLKTTWQRKYYLNMHKFIINDDSQLANNSMKY